LGTWEEETCWYEDVEDADEADEQAEKTESLSELELPEEVECWKGDGAYAEPGRGANWGTAGAW
jgi:hypothetical protein